MVIEGINQTVDNHAVSWIIDIENPIALKANGPAGFSKISSCIIARSRPGEIGIGLGSGRGIDVSNDNVPDIYRLIARISPKIFVLRVASTGIDNRFVQG